MHLHMRVVAEWVANAHNLAQGSLKPKYIYGGQSRLKTILKSPVHMRRSLTSHHHSVSNHSLL